jgi:hypothetical protein
MIATPQITAHQLARDAVDRYFEAISSAMPNDCTDQNLTAVCLQIESAIAAQERRDGREIPRADCAREAAYLVGVEVGRRLGRP